MKRETKGGLWIVDRGDNEHSPLPKQVAWTVVLRGRMARAGML